MPQNMEIETPLNAPKVKPGARRRRLTPLGQGWKRGLYPVEMNMPESSVNAVLTFETAPSAKEIADAFEVQIWPRDRFRSVVVDMDFVEHDGPMDRAYHFQERTMDNMKEIEEHCFRNATAPLDPNRPLWRFEVIRNKTGDDVVALKLHHCICDGLGVLFTFLPMLSLRSGGNLLDSIPLPPALKGGMKKTASGEDPMMKMSSEERKMGCCRRRCRNTSQFWKGVCSILSMGYDSEVKINPPISERKPYLPYSGRHRYTKMPVVDCKLISAARRVYKCTFNDVVMAGLSGAFRRYLETIEDPLIKKSAEVEMKSFMLLALPRPVTEKDPDAAIVNNFLTPVFRLPVSEPTPAARLEKTVAMVNDMKSRSFISGIWCTTKLVTKLLPVSLMKKITSEAISKLTCNITSVPLPDEPMDFAGKGVTGVQVIFVNNVPQISILSYQKELHWNMVSDPALIDKPELLGQFFEDELRLLGAGDGAAGS